MSCICATLLARSCATTLKTGVADSLQNFFGQILLD
jgi:hypothetical protein